MKHKCLFKGIITLVLLLFIGFIPLSVKPVRAYAGTTEPKLNVKSKDIVKGKSYALKVYNLTETQTVTYTSEYPKIASVDSKGVVKALSVGTTTVTAIIEDSGSDEPVKLQCKITVGPPALFVVLSRQEADMVVGQRALMYWLVAPMNTVELPKFSSSAPEIASVSAGGIVTAKSEGTAYIFAQIDNGHYSACCITVTAEGEAVAEAAFEPDSTFADFLIELNKNFTNSDNTSENTGADTAQ
ncbi:MAG: Ig-like domain-containing protein [Lachnospiraceae bacterium]|nr:Ig-like domain-containing protein [Lachnospiraceae bacterium]